MKRHKTKKNEVKWHTMQKKKKQLKSQKTKQKTKQRKQQFWRYSHAESMFRVCFRVDFKMAPVFGVQLLQSPSAITGHWPEKTIRLYLDDTDKGSTGQNKQPEKIFILAKISRDSRSAQKFCLSFYKTSLFLYLLSFAQSDTRLWTFICLVYLFGGISTPYN